MEPIAKVWYGLFKPKDFPEKVLKGFQENRPHIEVKFKATDWPILMAYIRRENMEMAEYIERDNASNLMLRSLSFALFIFAIVQVIQFAISLTVLHLIAGFFCGLLNYRYEVQFEVCLLVLFAYLRSNYCSCVAWIGQSNFIR